MNVHRIPHLLILALAALTLTACGSIGLPDILGGGGGGDDRRTTRNAVTVQGTVERVDTGSRLIVVQGDARYNLRNAGGGDRLTLYYDNGTTVVYQGRTYNPADLERGDRIVADVDDSGNRLIAQRIEVTHDVTGGTGGTGGGVYDDQRRLAGLRGTVRSVDTRSRTLQLERASYTSGFTTGTGTRTSGSDVVTVHYDAETVVEHQGRFYGLDSLERGDVVDVRVTESGSRLVAEQIELVRDVRTGSR